jgi:ELWxxDGT repeat protein
MGNTLFFIARPANSTTPGGAALFKTDGTTAGTMLVVPIDGVGVLAPSVGPAFISAGTKSYFQAYTTAAAQEVWVTDGTAAGTHQVADIDTANNGNPTFLGLIGTNLIFAEDTSNFTNQLFSTDGTAAGTQALSNFAQSQYGMVTESLAINGKVYVGLESLMYCCQPDLWATDGTSSGTVRIDSDEGYPTFHLQPSSLRAFGNSVALLTDTENRGTELSIVDTASNALTIFDMAPGPGSGASYGSTIAAMDGFILYLGGYVSSGLQLWRSDGTLAGTVMVMNMGQGVQLSQLGQNIMVTRVGNRAIFQSENAQNGPQLWGSDGTAQGTVPLIATPDSSSGFVQPLLGVVGAHGYYAVYTGTEYQLVVTDGTVAGTHVLADAGSLDPNALSDTQVVGDDNLTFIYTYHYDTASGNRKHLYAYAPQTNVVTHLLDNRFTDTGEPPLAYGGRLYFGGSDSVHGDQPWLSDGTVAGTHILVNLSNVAPVAGNDSASSENDMPVSINVVANDSEAGGGIIDPTSVQVASQPMHGSVSVTSSGSILYTPMAAFSGTDSFTYSVKDTQGAISNVATVTVTVTASSGGGGGAVTILDLLALGSLALMRRLWPIRAAQTRLPSRRQIA